MIETKMDPCYKDILSREGVLNRTCEVSETSILIRAYCYDIRDQTRNLRCGSFRKREHDWLWHHWS